MTPRLTRDKQVLQLHVHVRGNDHSMVCRLLLSTHCNMHNMGLCCVLLVNMTHPEYNNTSQT